jgi:hypothetical protein
MTEIHLPRSVQAALANPAVSGGRHGQIKHLVLPLLGAGLCPEAVFAQLRAMYDDGLDGVPDDEIRRLINWGIARNPGPATRRRGGGQAVDLRWHGKPLGSRIAKGEEAIANVKKRLTGFVCDEASLWDASQIRPADGASWQQDSILLLSTLYAPAELVSVDVNYRLDESGRVSIVPPERTQSAADWIAEIEGAGATPQSEAGCWIRLNPVKEIRGSGEREMHKDDDVAAFRDLLIESDELPYELALSFLARLPLPIVAIITPAGRGPHGWARLNSRDAADFRSQAKTILELLAPCGYDSSNCNPSRYGRLPGAKRILGAGPQASPRIRGQQRLLYLASTPKRGGIF